MIGGEQKVDSEAKEMICSLVKRVANPTIGKSNISKKLEEACTF
jgi:hypothetical protein